MSTETAARIRANYNDRAAAIKADPDLSNSGKLRQLEEAHAEAQERLHALREEEVAALRDRREHARRRAFQPAGDGLSPAEARADLRNATDRLDRAEDASEALRLVERAARTGDRQTAVAAASIAHERQWPGVLERAAEVAGRSDTVAELRDLSEQLDAPAANVRRSMAYSLPAPRL